MFMILHPETQLTHSLLQELESTRFLLEQSPLSKSDIQSKMHLLEQLQNQLYAHLSNLDFAYNQGQLPYDEYKDRQAQLLSNKRLEFYVGQISHVLQRCKEAVR